MRRKDTEMKIGILTSLNNNIEENIRNVRALGLDNCQLKCWDECFLTDEYLERTKRALEENGVTISGFWMGWYRPAVWDFYEGQLTLGLVPREYRFARMTMILKGAEFAAKLGIQDIITHVGYMPENPCSAEYNEMVACLKYICKILKTRDQYFLFETGQETPITLLRTIEDVGTGNLGVNLDPANLLLYGKANPVDSLYILGPYVRGVHAKDGFYPTNGKKLGRQADLGAGLVNFPVLLRRLRDYGYDRPLTIEYEIKSDSPNDKILEAKAFLENILEEMATEQAQAVAELSDESGDTDLE